jgi:hypothetical protein
VEPFNGFFPPVPVNQVVPIGNDISQGTALVAKGNATIHATGGLGLEMVRMHRKIIFFPIFDPFSHGPFMGQFAPRFHKSGRFSHFYSLAELSD